MVCTLLGRGEQCPAHSLVARSPMHQHLGEVGPVWLVLWQVQHQLHGADDRPRGIERAAREWKDRPAKAAETSITCLSCHAPGRLAARRAALEKEQ